MSMSGARQIFAHALLALCSVAGVLAMAAAAEAQETVAVLGLTSIDGDDEYARNLTGALRHEASSVRGWSVIERDVALSQLELVAGCEAPDPACLAQIAQTVGVQRVIFGTIQRTSGDHYEFALSIHAYSAASGQVELNVDRNLSSTRTDIDDLRGPAREIIAGLSNVARTGTIRVVASAGQEVRVDDQVVGTTDAGGTLVASDVAAGPHQVTVGGGAAQSVTVGDGGEALVQIASSSSSSGGGGSGPQINWLAIGLLGGAAVALGGTIYTWARLQTLSNDGPYNDYRNQLGGMGLSGDIACQDSSIMRAAAGSQGHIRDVCSEGNTLEILQYVFLGVAVAAGATGAVLLVLDSTSSSSAEHQVSITPTFGPNYGGLQLRTTF
jgi:hypothetical protein